MKILVAYYSLTGRTKKVAEEISKNLNSDLDEIIDKKNRRGIIGFISEVNDALKKDLTEIEYKKDPKTYDVIIIGTPIWASTMTPAVRAYLKNNSFKKVAFFATSGLKVHKAFNEMEKLSKKPIATIGSTYKDFDKNEIKVPELIHIKEFCSKINEKK